ncbi:DUF2066 domain-containing protein [Seongchinamella sediminis]|uniref:DUF2066 domain-containing protein n=1 Tax=Seongchinamella sediminis TaxID=2283635 RepID=A0A3L7E0A8_9GAMM|nr:DUF2066 domain-containing protein [Seongchinamella sediminis]RLQ21681.1 DUF2066 domain-containing protein [Seongchinamella sediminis]
MSKSIQWLFMALTLFAGAAAAEVVRNLHSAQVPVSNQSSSALASASRDALAEVLVKVSGSEEVLQHPDIVTALAEARSHVQQYAYVRNDRDSDELSARFEFDDSYINRLLTNARLPLWTANRPRVLVWMAVEMEGARQLVSFADTPELAAQLVTAFERRGVPLQLPLFDLADATAISVDDVWEQRGPVVQSASARYRAEHLLVGRAVVLSSGQWTGDWSYFFGIHRLDRGSQTPAAAGFIRDGVALAAEEMASRYAVAPTGAADDRVRMVVSGVVSFSDYTAIVNWLESLELIEHANVESINGERVEFGLDTAADAAQLATIIELNKRLQREGDLPGQLVYQWTN